MSVVQSIEDVGPCRKQLRIEVPPPAVEAEHARVTGEYGRKARIPGFRKGRVPAELVRRHFGKEIEQEVLERLVPRYWKQAAAEKSIDALGAPQVEAVEHRPGEALTFVAVVEVRPEIELRNYRDFALPEPQVEPSREEVAQALAELRRSHAEWLTVERPAAAGDRVRARVVETSAGAAAEAQEAEFELGAPRVWEEVSLAATGASAGQTVRFSRREGDGEAARERSFELEVQAVQEAKLPALDDELAAHFKLDSLAALEADVVRRLRAARREEARRVREQALLDQLTERHPMPLPEGVVHHETEDLLREYAENLAHRGVDLEHAQVDWQAVGEQARPHAERRVRARLLLDAIAEQERIAVAEEELEQALALLARVQGLPTQALRQRLGESGEIEGLRARMRREKTVRFLLGEESPAAAGAPAAAAPPDGAEG